MIRKKIAAAAAAWLCTFPSYATDALALEVGRGEDRTSLLRFAVVDRWNREPRALGRKWQLSGYWEFPRRCGTTPRKALRTSASRPYFASSAACVFSTAVQFGEHVGVGWRSGHWHFAARLQHLSNAGLDHPNPGINFVLVRAQYELH